MSNSGTLNAPAPVIDRDGHKTYTHPVTGQQLTSVTSVLGATHAKPYLAAWEAKLAATYAVDHLDQLAALVAAGQRDEAVALVKGEAARTRDIKADVGSHVHAVAEALILWAASPEGRGSDIALPDIPEHLAGATVDGETIEARVDALVRGWVEFVTRFDPEFESAEMTAYNPGFGIAGTIDCTLRLRDVQIDHLTGRLQPSPGSTVTLCVDIKTGRNLDCTVPEQLAAYRRMTQALLPLGQLVRMPRTDGGAVLHVRPEHRDGYKLVMISGPADEAAWLRFRRALDVHHGRRELGRRPGPVVYPLRADGTMQPPYLEDLDGAGYARTVKPLVAAGLDTLEDVAKFTEADLLGIKGIGPKGIAAVRAVLSEYGLTLNDGINDEWKVA